MSALGPDACTSFQVTRLERRRFRAIFIAGCTALAACSSASKSTGGDGGTGQRPDASRQDASSSDAAKTDAKRALDATPEAASDGPVVVACAAPAPPATGSPTIFMAPSPVSPGQVALLFGAAVGAEATVRGARLADGNPGMPPRPADCVPASAVPLQVVQADELSAKAVIPSSWPAGVYALAVSNAKGAGAPVTLNRARVDWLHSGPGGVVVAGATVDVYGRSLGANPRAWLVDATGKSTELSSSSDAGTSSDGYAATFAVPALASGAYSLYLHNGLGGPAGFSNPFAATVAPAVVWPTTVFKVSAGTGDDDGALATALGDAQTNGGGVVQFASGNYTLTKGVTVPTKTIITSASGNRADVNIAFNEATTPFPYGFAGAGDFVVESITVTSSTSARLFQCPAGADFLRDPSTGEPQNQPDPPCENAKLHDVSFTMSTLRDVGGNGAETFTLLAVINGNDSEVSNSTLTNEGGGALVISQAHGDYVKNNTLVSGTTRVAPTASMPLSSAETSLGAGCGLFGLSTSAIVGNTIGPSPTLGSAATMYLEYDAFDLYIADNKIGPNLSNYGEGFSFDAPYYPNYLGIPSATSGRDVTIPIILNAAGNSVFGGPETGQWEAGSSSSAVTLGGSNLAGQEVLVVNGTGLGQYAVVVSNVATAAGATQFTIDRDWSVPLDATSVIALVVRKSQVVFARNMFHDVAVGAQLYAGGYDFLIDGTGGESIEGTYAFVDDFMSQRASSATDLQRRFSGAYFDQWINTTLTSKVDATYPWVDDAGQGVFTPYSNGLIGIHASIGGNLQPPQRAVNAVGNILRSNTVQNFTLGLNYNGSTGSSTVPTVGEANLIEGNTTQDVPIGVFVSPNFPGTVIRNNTCSTGCTTPVEDESDGG